MISIQQIDYKNDFPIFFMGPPLSQGPLPAFFYFALSAEESLNLAPYNQPALSIPCEKIRVFSFTLPSHGKEFNKHQAMELWKEEFLKENLFLDHFFNEAILAIDFLIEKGWVNPQSIATGGLSRGGFIAIHLAARHKKVSTVLGFAPLTTFTTVEEFAPLMQIPHIYKKISSYDLIKLSQNLLHIKNLRFYIGNRDTRVGTDPCYFFIRSLTEEFYENKIRPVNIELIISQSIGHKGHGTNPHLFDEGASWVNNKILG